MVEEKEKLSTARAFAQPELTANSDATIPLAWKGSTQEGDQTIKCPTCGMEFRVAWVKEGLPESGVQSGT